LGPIVNQSSTPDDNLTGPGACGDGTGAAYQGRCGYGPRQPLLMISPYAKVNYVDHTVTDQASILKFIEDNWSLGRIGDNSMDAMAGSLLGMFNFTGAGAKAVYLDPTKGTVVAPPTAGGGTTPTQTTTAVANPKNASVSSRQFQLDGSASTSFDGKALTYSWTLAPGSLSAAILGATTAMPTIQFGSNQGAYTFLLTVTDSKGNTSTDTTTITYVGQ
jgi:phospholipase C